MAKDADHEWQLAITSLIAEVKANQENLHTKLEDYCDSTNKRQEKIEHIVIGNGKPGLSEEVRSLKGKWAAIYGIGILLLSAMLNYAVEASIYNRQLSNPRASTEEVRRVNVLDAAESTR